MAIVTIYTNLEAKKKLIKRLNLAREKFEEEKPKYENIEKAKGITQDQSTWSRKVDKENKNRPFNKYKIEKAKKLQLRYRLAAEKEGKRRPWDEGYEVWKEKRRRKAERKAYEEKFARLEAKRKGIAYVSLADSSDEESDWSVEEQAEAKGELDFCSRKQRKLCRSSSLFWTKFLRK